MEKVNGSPDVKLLECTNPVRDYWRIRFDVQAKDDGTADYMEHQLYAKPTLQQVKAIITEYINGQTDQKILSGLTYQTQMVWLSAENQANYKAAYDLAVQTQGENLPYKVKLGSEDEPSYREFSSLQDFKAFYLSIQRHIDTAIQEGWAKKDAIDWSQYQ